MPRPTLKLGSKGSDVSAWQLFIGSPADGVFGPATSQATQAWQTANGLAADGVVGPATWAAAGLPDGMPAPRDPWALGVDTSQSQGTVDWPALQAARLAFAFIKATDGLRGVDPKWAANSAAAAQAGLDFGAYHVLEPGGDPSAQAAHFADVANGQGTLAPVLDFELAKGLKAVDALARAVAFLDAVEAAWGNGVSAIVYTYPLFLDGLRQQAGAAADASLAALATRRLWIANYGVNKPRVPLPWQAWAAWQFAGDGGYRMPNGVVVDVDWAQGGVDSLK